SRCRSQVTDAAIAGSVAIATARCGTSRSTWSTRARTSSVMANGSAAGRLVSTVVRSGASRFRSAGSGTGGSRGLGRRAGLGGAPAVLAGPGAAGGPRTVRVRLDVLAGLLRVAHVLDVELAVEAVPAQQP